MKPVMLVFGLGYSGLAVARRLTAGGWRVRGTSRSPARLASLEAHGIAGTTFEPGLPFEEAVLDEVTHLLLSVPPDDQGDPVLNMLSQALAKTSRLGWIGYLSTTGVYGDTGGAWIDETAMPSPTNPRGRRRVAAEAAWQAFGAGLDVPVQVFRLAGIYGPGRSAFDDLRRRTARRIVKPGHAFSRIHVEDIAGAVVAGIASPHKPGIYNVCDDRPAPSADVVEYAAGLLGLPAPEAVPYETAVQSMSPMAREFWSNNRRVCNRRIKDELGLQLLYPDYESGLRAILDQERTA